MGSQFTPGKRHPRVRRGHQSDIERSEAGSETGGDGSGPVAEDRDLVLADALALLGVVDPETFLGSEAEHAELALGLVAVHGERRLADLVEVVGRLSSGWMRPWSSSLLAAHASA